MDPQPIEAEPARGQFGDADWPGPVGRPARARWWAIQPPPPGGTISAGRAYAEVLIVYAAFFAVSIILGGEMLAGRYPKPDGSWAIFAPETVRVLSFSVLAILVVVLLSGRRGITAWSLGTGWPRAGDRTAGAAASLRIAAWAVTALLAGGAVTAALAHGHRLGQPLSQDYSYLVYTLAASLNAGIVEEMVALAFVVTTLRQAHRPVPEIVIVAVLLRCAYHDYYGLGVVGIAVWASIFIWLFLRTGSVLPLIAVHVLWDASIFLAQRWHFVVAAQFVVVVLVLATAAISWLVSRASRQQQVQPQPGTAGAWPPVA